MPNPDERNELSFFGDVIYTYTRAQAIADGVLIEVTEMAREAGFRWSVAMTDGAWQDCVAWSDPDNAAQIYQEEAGRLWDVLTMAFYGLRRAGGFNDELPFALLRVPRDGHSTQPVETTLKLIVSVDDDRRPAFTILLAHED